jgi:hypothetical protein
MSSNFSDGFRPFTTEKEKEVGWKLLEKSRDIPSEILLPCSSKFSLILAISGSYVSTWDPVYQVGQEPYREARLKV